MGGNGWSWWAGSSNEWYSCGPFETRDDAIVAGRHAFGGADFCIVEGAQKYLRFDADDLIQHQYFDADELFSYDDGGEPERIGSVAAINEADAELQAALDAWVAKWGHTLAPPTLFAGTRNEETIPGDVP